MTLDIRGFIVLQLLDMKRCIVHSNEPMVHRFDLFLDYNWRRDVQYVRMLALLCVSLAYIHITKFSSMFVHIFVIIITQLLSKPQMSFPDPR